MLQQSGVDVSVDELRSEIYLPGREGTLQVEMLAGIRRHDRVAVGLDGTQSDLVRALEAGYPVLILQHLTALWLESWHYAVVIGYDPQRDAFVLRSGSHATLAVPRRELLASWRGADDWGYVVVRPDATPGFVSPVAYLQGVIGLEQAGRLAAAGTAYRHAMTRWPDEAMFGFGYGNVLVEEGDPAGAVRAYDEVLARHPGHAPTMNNLAWVLGEQGCRAMALQRLDAMLARGDLTDAERRLLEDTRQEIVAGVRDGPCRLAP